MKEINLHNFFDKKKISLVFLGIGLVTFILNISTIIRLLPTVETAMSISKSNPLIGYYISVISSIVLIVYSIYNLFTK